MIDIFGLGLIVFRRREDIKHALELAWNTAPKDSLTELTQIVVSVWEDVKPHLGAPDLQEKYDTAWVQYSLNRFGLRSLAIDGKMGPRTVAAIEAFQAQHNLKVDGLAGPATMAEIKHQVGQL